MKINRLNVLITALIVVSVGSNIFNMAETELFEWPEEARYNFPGMFKDSVVFYRPRGTESLAMIDMTDSVITVSKFGDPLNCMALNIHTKDGIINGPCVSGVGIALENDE